MCDVLALRGHNNKTLVPPFFKLSQCMYMQITISVDAASVLVDSGATPTQTLQLARSRSRGRPLASHRHIPLPITAMEEHDLLSPIPGDLRQPSMRRHHGNGLTQSLGHDPTCQESET